MQIRTKGRLCMNEKNPRLAYKKNKVNKHLIIIAITLTLSLVLAFAVMEVRKNSCQNWRDGWAAWMERNPEKALALWNQNKTTLMFSPRPARIYYWSIRACLELGQFDVTEKLSAELFQKFPTDFYTFMLHPNAVDLISQNKLKKIKIHFPRPWEEEVSSASEITGLPKSTIWSVMKRESRFLNNAVSKAGAVGLMQLMPLTAQNVAKQMDLDLNDLSNPKENIMIGATYFALLQKKFNSDLIRVSAAYNAGETIVVKWDTLNSKDWAEWIENIPYAETREFVRSVLENRELYRAIYADDEFLSLYEIVKNPLITINCTISKKITKKDNDNGRN